MKTIYLQGPDPRLSLLGQTASQRGFRVDHTIPEKPEKDALYLFAPSEKKENIRTALEKAESGSVFFLWKKDPVLYALAEKKKIRIQYVLEDEAYRLQNARQTAEGVLGSIIQNTDRTLSEECLLIYGYGNCGKEIAKILWLFGCEIFIWSRERGCKKALEDGFNIYPAPQKGLSMFDGVINTVPDPVFPPPLLSTLRQGTHFFQVASGTSGIAVEDFKKAGVIYHDLHSLPGKFSPATDADALLDLLTADILHQKERIPI